MDSYFTETLISDILKFMDNNPMLSDETIINKLPWSVLKKTHMMPNFKTSSTFVSDLQFNNYINSDGIHV